MSAPPPGHVRAFARAAGYDAHARVQREVAAWMAAELDRLPAPARLLEIGCGTGFLRALTAIAARDWLMTDIAPEMLARAGAGAVPPGTRFAPLDAEHPAFDPPEAPFDVIAGSLVVQWFGDLAGGLVRLFRLLAPGGTLIVTTLMAGSLREWRAACGGDGSAAGTPDFPSAATLAAMRLDGCAPTLASRAFVERHADARAFLHGLKAIGAGTPRPFYRPLSPAAVRDALARFDREGRVATYEVAMLSFRRMGEQA